jgi:cytochrome c556
MLPAMRSDEKGFVAGARKTEEMAERLAEIAQGGTPNLKAALAAFDQPQQEGCNGCHRLYAKLPSEPPSGG